MSDKSEKPKQHWLFRLITGGASYNGVNYFEHKQRVKENEESLKELGRLFKEIEKKR